MYCPNCGHQCNEEWEFCPKCSNKFPAKSSTPKNNLHGNTTLVINDKVAIYKKTWFIWLTIIIFFPVGLFLLWKYGNYSKKTKSIITAIILLLAIIGTHNNSTHPQKTNTQSQSASAQTQQQAKPNPEQLKAQQEAFNKWYSTVENDINRFDNIWEIWTKTFDGMSQGQISRYQAYENMKRVYSQMDSLSTSMSNRKPPAELSKEHKKLLEEGMSDLSSAATYRGFAAKKALEMLDENDFKPSTVDNLKTTVQQADSHLLKGLANIVSVQTALGIEKKSQ